MKQIGLFLLAFVGCSALAGQLDCRYLGYNGFRYGYVQATMTADQSVDIPARAEYERWSEVDNPNVETRLYETLHSQITSMIYIPGQEMRYTLSNDEVQEQVVMHFNGDLFVGVRTVVWKNGSPTYDTSIAMCRFR